MDRSGPFYDLGKHFSQQRHFCPFHAISFEYQYIMVLLESNQFHSVFQYPHLNDAPTDFVFARLFKSHNNVKSYSA